MSVLRVHRRKRDFTITVNTTPRDRRLSARARGVLWFLLTQRDGYPVNAAKMAAEEFPEGRDALERAIRELITCGYLTRRREQNERGQWITYTDVYETPELASDQAAENGIPGVGEPGTDNGFSGVGGAAGQGTYAQVAPTTGKPTVGEPGAKNLRTKTKGQEQGQLPSVVGSADSAADPNPEVVEAELIDDPEVESQPKPETAQTVYAAYLDWRRAEGIADPDKRMCGQITKQLAEAFAAGHTAEVIKRGLWAWHHSSYGPSSLGGYIDADARGGSNGNGNGRLSEHDRRRLASVQELLTAGGAA